MRIALFTVCAALLLACNTTLDVAHYDQSCSVDSDCVAAFTGELCAVCGGCANTALNVAAKAKYDADAKGLRSACPPQLGEQARCGPCDLRAPVCSAGTCALAPR